MSKTTFLYSNESETDFWLDDNLPLKGLKSRLLEFFKQNILPVSINVVWFDYAALMSDLTIKEILHKSLEGDERHMNYRPSIIIGTQAIDQESKDDSKIYHDKIKQFDNNIHTFYCQITEWEKFENTLLECVCRIRFNANLGLYQSQITKEYFEFYLRMIGNNHLQGGHSSTVIPFVFTSEEVMYSKAREYARKVKRSSPDAVSLNILLVDDHASEPLVAIKTESSVLKSKTKILEAVWQRFNEETESDIKLNVQIIQTPDIKELEAFTGDETPDIILLDYNFNTTESGVDFVSKLLKSRSVRKGPFGKFWLFPITSFSNAFIDEMQNEGLGFIDDNYELSRGADFINTPGLFLFYMMQMIWNIVSKSDLETVSKEIMQVSEEMDSLKSWDDIKNRKKAFEKYYKQFVNRVWNLESVLESETGILKSLRKPLETKFVFVKQLNLCKELLFNLTSKNYEGNEDIIILINELKRTIS